MPVADFADGDRIVEVTPVGSVQLYHLMLGRHATMRIGGIEMESYHPGKSLVRSMGESTAALFLSLFPNIGQAEDFGELPGDLADDAGDAPAGTSAATDHEDATLAEPRAAEKNQSLQKRSRARLGIR